GRKQDPRAPLHLAILAFLGDPDARPAGEDFAVPAHLARSSAAWTVHPAARGPLRHALARLARPREAPAAPDPLPPIHPTARPHAMPRSDTLPIWLDGTRATAGRIAWLATGDLGAALAALARLDPSAHASRAEALRAPALADLVGFAVGGACAQALAAPPD